MAPFQGTPKKRGFIFHNLLPERDVTPLLGVVLRWRLGITGVVDPGTSQGTQEKAEVAKNGSWIWVFESQKYQ